ncbi:MAG: iron-sulfur cluster assembly scaffold protein [Candidatus Bilamarchaeaceae archaeon]
MYSEEVMKRFKDPKFAGKMENPDAVGEAGNPKCGDVMRIQLKVEGGAIKDIKFQTYGCVAAIASSDMMCELVQGKKLEDAKKLQPKEIADRLVDMPPIKLHCSVLGMEALNKAIKSYEKKAKNEG